MVYAASEHLRLGIIGRAKCGWMRMAFGLNAGRCGGDSNPPESVCLLVRREVRLQALRGMGSNPGVWKCARSYGRWYVFNYVLHRIDLTTNPDDAPPITATFTDRFSLIGQGNAPNLLVAFEGLFSIDQDGNLTIISITPVKGDPNCDPI